MVRHGELPTAESSDPAELSPLPTAPVTLQPDTLQVPSSWESPEGSPKASPLPQGPESALAPSGDTTAALCLRVRTLEAELETCRQELRDIQRRLSHSERLHRCTETRNLELQKQVEQLSRELHERKRAEQTAQEVQTDGYYGWAQSDYCSSGNDYSGFAPGMSEQVSVTEDSNSSQVVAEAVLNKAGASSGQFVEEVQEDTVYAQQAEEEQGCSLADSLRATAEAAVTQTGFVYDENTGMYYDHSTGFYYDSESQLYYDGTTGIYYYCDVDSGRYLYHSRVDLQSFTDTNPQPTKDKRSKKKRRDPASMEKEEEKDTEKMEHEPVSPPEREELAAERKKARMGSLVESYERESSSSDESEPEEGEITDSDNEKTSSDDDRSSGLSVTSHTSEPEDPERIWPPCIRVTVVRSPVLQKGTLFIITADKTATIGREKDLGHTIRIPELGISKFHAEVYFDHNLQSYVLVDQGSQNGTVINGNHILQPKEVSQPCVLQHGDEVKFGETVLSFHVHPGSETCDGCEPGQVRAHLRLNKKEEHSAGPVLTKEGKELLRKQGLKKIRAKYGLQSADYEDNKVLTNPKYKDRAGRRRQVVGSDGTFQKEEAPASVHVEINDNNKGRKMLEKMGWKKGEGLGKSSDGIRDPIQLQLRKKKAGLGAQNPTSIEDIQPTTQNKKNWEKARERYAEAFPDAKTKNETKTSVTWIKGSIE
ncbi:angiogenic factor with G patch and FHA domains 1 isoform X2 [Xenopus tropicalis]|uniref:Angiogenic factor with G patch and FHA domains 1 n=1 Tax=Xenopus tropicalis TaxID=8364 RepID=A0A8J1IYA1_XENTR|nr:angiogenic factor with G patch and FHA domains 1 isoform X2 [Xenopus tropicalis]